MVIGWYVVRHVQSVIGARFDDIAPLTSMGKLRCPVLLVHGKQDELVPFADAQCLQAAGLSASGRVQCLAVAGGHDPSEALAEHLPALMVFLQAAMPLAAL